MARALGDTKGVNFTKRPPPVSQHAIAPQLPATAASSGLLGRPGVRSAPSGGDSPVFVQRWDGALGGKWMVVRGVDAGSRRPGPIEGRRLGVDCLFWGGGAGVSRGLEWMRGICALTGWIGA